MNLKRAVLTPLLAISHLRPALANRQAEKAQGGQLCPSTFPSLTSAFTFSTNMTRAPVIAISHGGGPMPLLGDPTQKDLAQSLRTEVPKILKLNTPEAPRAIVLVTAHWSEKNPTISNGKKHELYYDYGGFPPEAYKLKYDAPGSPEVASEVEKALKEVGFSPQLDDERGWDHGVFVPMLLIEPNATTPIVQLSVLDSEDPADHFKMGQALATLRDSNIAIIGSGFATFHNLRLMFSGVTNDPAFQDRNRKWSEKVSEGVLEPELEQRKKRLDEWRNWPHAYEMHPRYGAEHFLPLIVCAGAAGKGKGKSYTDKFLGMDLYSFYWD